MNALIAELGMLAHRAHFWNDMDNWYSCPKAPEGCSDPGGGTECNCGAEAHNAKVDALLAKLETEFPSAGNSEPPRCVGNRQCTAMEKCAEGDPCIFRPPCPVVEPLRENSETKE